jgi:O-antigen/teichoic acid export membrane protein
MADLLKDMIGRLSRLLRSRFTKRVGSLSLATLVGQAIGLLSLAIIARTFAQEDVGAYGVFLSYGAIATALALLCYEISLPNLPEEDVPAFLAGLMALATLAGGLVLIGFSIAGYEYAWPLALFIAAGGIGKLSEMANIRSQRFKLIAVFRLANPLLLLFILGMVFVLGLRNPALIIWGNALAVTVTAVVYGTISLRPHLKAFAPSRLLALMLDKKMNALLLAPSEIANNAAYNLPVILIDSYFSAALAAQYSMMLKFCFGPAGLIGSVVGQVYHGHLADSIRHGDTGIYERYRQMRNYLLLAGGGIAVGIITMFPWLMRLILGEGWDEAGAFAQILAPIVGAMVVSAPLSMVFYVTERQGFLFAVQFGYLAISLVAFGVAIGVSNLWFGIALFSALSMVRYWIILSKIDRTFRAGFLRKS